jgi:hypothetical protein
VLSGEPLPRRKAPLGTSFPCTEAYKIAPTLSLTKHALAQAAGAPNRRVDAPALEKIHLSALGGGTRVAEAFAGPSKRSIGIGLLCLTFLVCARAEAAVDSYIDFDSHDAQTELAAGREDGVVSRNGSTRLSPGRTRGTLTSKAYVSATKFDTLVPS